jgi:hypothetical protein
VGFPVGGVVGVRLSGGVVLGLVVGAGGGTVGEGMFSTVAPRRDMLFPGSEG